MGVARPDLRYIDMQAPAEGRLAEVAPGVHWARFALPFRLNHINVWLIEERSGLTIVDSGVADDRTKAQWQAIAGNLGSSRRVERLVATHHHPDHCGLAGWVAQRFGAPVAMSRTEWLLGQYYLHDGTPALCDVNARFYHRAGYPAGFFEGQDVLFTSITQDFPTQFQMLEAGATTVPGGEWAVMTFGGHAPEHVCLYSAARRLLIAGDQVLPVISPIVGVVPHEPDDSPLDDFLQSLEALRDLPSDTLVLPSHGQPYSALHARLDALAAHHDRRLAELFDVLASPGDAAALTTKLFPDVGPGFDRIFALSETVAHARCLEARGQVRRSVNSEGVDIYRRVR
jgi:glyoxylase-like metal-dependent hydrolase (beta-lactamase superfamily II)